MSNFISFIKHETTGANLNLDFKRYENYILNMDNINFITFDEQFGNGYGERLPRLGINIAGSEIVLYRDDAHNFLKEIKELKL